MNKENSKKFLIFNLLIFLVSLIWFIIIFFGFSYSEVEYFTRFKETACMIESTSLGKDTCCSERDCKICGCLFPSNKTCQFMKGLKEPGFCCSERECCTPPACNYYGLTSCVIFCESCYNPSISFVYKIKSSNSIEWARQSASKNDCQDSELCAASYVDSYKIGNNYTCYYDRINPNSVIFSRNYTLNYIIAWAVPASFIILQILFFSCMIFYYCVKKLAREISQRKNLENSFQYEKE